MALQPSVGLSSLTGEVLLDESALEQAVVLFTVVFGTDHSDKVTLEHSRVAMLVAEACRRNYGWREFFEQCQEFFARQKYPTWKLADFFDIGRVEVYDYSWMLLRVKERRENGKLIGCYDTPIGLRYGWIAEIGDRLPLSYRRHEMGDLTFDEPAISVSPVISEMIAAARKRMESSPGD